MDLKQAEGMLLWNMQKAQLCSVSLASGLILHRNMKHWSYFHRAVWWKCLLTERKQRFYYKL